MLEKRKLKYFDIAIITIGIGILFSFYVRIIEHIVYNRIIERGENIDRIKRV